MQPPINAVLRATSNFDGDLLEPTETEDFAPSEAAALGKDNLRPIEWSRSVWQPGRLAKGHAVTYVGHRGCAAGEPAEPEATEWTSGQPSYREVPLKYVSTNVQRYFSKTIALVDDAAREHEFTGTKYPAEVSDWLLALEEVVNIGRLGDERAHLGQIPPLRESSLAIPMSFLVRSNVIST